MLGFSLLVLLSNKIVGSLSGYKCKVFLGCRNSWVKRAEPLASGGKGIAVGPGCRGLPWELCCQHPAGTLLGPASHLCILWLPLDLPQTLFQLKMSTSLGIFQGKGAD